MILNFVQGFSRRVTLLLFVSLASPHASHAGDKFDDLIEQVLAYHSAKDLPLFRRDMTAEKYKEAKKFAHFATEEAKDKTPTKKETSAKDTDNWWDSDDSEEEETLTLSNIAELLIDFSKSDISRFFTERKRGELTLSTIEELFFVNLGETAEELCQRLERKVELPKTVTMLRQIFKGNDVDLSGKVSLNFLKVAYRVANHVLNYKVVRKLQLNPTIRELEGSLRKKDSVILSGEPDPVHEPYWTYNAVQIKDYAKKIISKIEPVIILENQISKSEKSAVVKIGEESVSVRRIEGGFGRVLPNLYLKKLLQESKTQAVPRIFLLPKRPGKQEVTFIFQMPYSENVNIGIFTGLEDPGFNAVQVFCHDFEVYQEFIEGQGSHGDQSFARYGHKDFNAVQIVTAKNNKKYLIDSKEGKNFFVPYLSPWSDNGHKAQKEISFELKSLHFDPRLIYIKINVDLPRGANASN